jgi:hypothetical protein
MAAVLKAMGKVTGKQQVVSENAFSTMWAELRSGAESLMEEFEASVRARATGLTEDQLDAVLEPHRERLALALTSPDEVIKRCRTKQAAKDAAAAEARAAKAAAKPPKPPKPPKEHLIVEETRDEAIEILRKHKFDVLTASEGAAKNGYLSNDHLKMLCIDKGVYAELFSANAPNPPNRVQMMNKLVKAKSFAAEEKAAEGGASSDDSDSDSDS